MGDAVVVAEFSVDNVNSKIDRKKNKIKRKREKKYIPAISLDRQEHFWLEN